MSIPFNSKYPYMRFVDGSSRINAGTDTIQTSGNLPLTGNNHQVGDYSIHTYQVVPLESGPWDGEFRVEVSNDNVNYNCIYRSTISGTDSAIAYSDEWAFAYSRGVITGTAGSFLINERHLAP